MTNDLYNRALSGMRSNFQFPLDKIFPPTGIKQQPKSGRHADSIELALSRSFGRRDVFIDCQPSLSRASHNVGAVPCVMPTHPIYFVRQERYLEARDFLHAQGIWESGYKPEVYQSILDDKKNLGQKFAGNSFSSTVSQAVTIAALVSADESWTSMGGDGQQTGGQGGEVERPSGILRRLRKKRAAPEYDRLGRKPPQRTPQRSAQSKMRRVYKRKEPGVDSRKMNASGKSSMATIWQKEQVPGFPAS